MVLWDVIERLARDKQKYTHPDPGEAYKQAITAINRQLVKEAQKALEALEKALREEQKPEVKTFIKKTLDRVYFQLEKARDKEYHD